MYCRPLLPFQQSVPLLSPSIRFIRPDVYSTPSPDRKGFKYLILRTIPASAYLEFPKCAGADRSSYD